MSMDFANTVSKEISSKEIITRLKTKYYKGLYKELVDNEKKISREDMFGPTPPNMLIGSYGYPDVRMGSIISMDNPVTDLSKLYGKDYSTILKTFALTLNGETNHNVRQKSKVLETMQEAVLSSKPIDVEMRFKNKPKLSPTGNSMHIPTGYRATITNVKIAQNPVVPKIVDRIVNDEIKSVEMLRVLYKRGIDTYYLTRLLSGGIMGLQDNKKLVPTKWSITAVDDILAKQNMEYIRTLPQINEFLVFENEFLHNHFIILLMPGSWEYEQFEAWPHDSPWATGWGFNEEHESYEGRKKYATLQAGGYYASRLPATEYLSDLKRQARVIVFREIGQEYCVPVGVWEVRENVRNAFKQVPKKFNLLNEALEYIRPKLNVSLDKYLAKSKILAQSRITDWI